MNNILATNRNFSDLISEPREALDIEIKDWLDLSTNEHRATLAKEIIALANHGGGTIVIGFEELSDGSFRPSAGPSDLSAWSTDAVHSVVSKYVDPPFQCEVVHQQAAGATKHPVIVVPGGHRVPVRARAGSPDGSKLVANRVYIRRAGPNSEEPRSTEEWDGLFSRIVKSRQDELLESMRSIINGVVPVAGVPPAPTLASKLSEYKSEAISRWNARVAPLSPDAPPRFIHGYYDAAFAIDGVFDRVSMRDLSEVVRRSVRNHSGWPPFLTITRSPYAPAAIDGAVETWIGPDLDGSFDTPSHHDFWRVSPDGFLFTRRGYQEDGKFKDIPPATTFDITTPTWRLGEAILEAVYIAQALGATQGNLVFQGAWTGLRGRKLVSLGNPNRFLSGTYVAQQDRFDASQTFSIEKAQGALPEIVWEILHPLYELFDFFSLPKSLVEAELEALRRRTF